MCSSETKNLAFFQFLAFFLHYGGCKMKCCGLNNFQLIFVLPYLIAEEKCLWKNWIANRRMDCWKFLLAKMFSNNVHIFRRVFRTQGFFHFVPEKKQDGPLPPAYFRPIFLLKMLFKRLKAFSLQKILSLFFLNFPKLKKINFFKIKDFTKTYKRHFWELVSFDIHSATNLPPPTICEKFMFSSKKNIFFTK